MTSNLIQAASKRVHHSSLESSFRKGRIAFTALSAVVATGKAISISMLLGVVEGEVPDTFVAPATAEDEPELI